MNKYELNTLNLAKLNETDLKGCALLVVLNIQTMDLSDSINILLESVRSEDFHTHFKITSMPELSKLTVKCCVSD